MSIQLNLPGTRPVNAEARRLARRADPQTSHDAAARVHEFQGQQHAQILAVLKAHGNLTVHEMAAFCNLSAHEIGKRCSELERWKQAEVVKDEKGHDIVRNSPSGRPARVWRSL